MADEETGGPVDGEDAGKGAEEVLPLKNDFMSSPLFILVALMAYIAECGGREIPVEQKAVFLAILRKHVNKGDIGEKELHLMLRDAFDLTLRIEFQHYLESITPVLTMGQRFSVIANLYNMMMVDGEIRDGEEARIDLCRRKFELDPRVIRQIRRVSLLRNDTSIFLDPNHPCNDPAFYFHLDHS